MKEYLAGAFGDIRVRQMRKVVLEVKDEDRLLEIGYKLSEAKIAHRVWVRFVCSSYHI